MVRLSRENLEGIIYRIDGMFTCEVNLYGSVSYWTKYQRHYYLKRLLELQLKEFNHV